MNELISDNISIDLTENIPIPLNFAIADIKDPSKRKRNFSKEIILPDTSPNRAFFAGSFGLHVTDNAINFDSTASTPAILKKRGVVIMPDAVIQLREVVRLDDNLSFKIQLFSETVNVFLLLSNINVNELDWSDYDHNLTQANIVASWSAAIGTGYVYPLIERGIGRLALTTFKVTDLIPYAYYREVLIKTLEYADITYNSNFIDSDRFKSMLFGYGGGTLPTATPADIDLQKVDINSGDYTDAQEVFPVDLNTLFGETRTKSNFLNKTLNDTYFSYVVNQDDIGQFVDSKIYIQQTGNYNLSFSISLDWIYDVGAMDFQNAGSPTIVIKRNGASFVFTNKTGGQGLSISGTTDYSVNSNLFFNAGDTIEFEVKYNSCSAVYTLLKENITLNITTSTSGLIELNRLDTALTDNSPIKLNQFLPSLKCSDFLLGAVRHFNLYLSDPDINKVTTIEPLTSYYSNTNQFDDITKDIEHRKPFTMKSTANDYAKNIIFSFKSMTDYDAGVYREEWQEEYGDLNYQQGSYFAKGDMKIQLPYSTIVPYQLNDDIILPRFQTIDANNNAKPNKSAPRIMMWNGLKSGAWTLANDDGTSLAVKTDYPSVHHFDDYTDPSFDLNFKLVNEVYYNTDIVTNVNAYSEYYSEFIQEMTNPAGKLIECFVKWDSNDVSSKDFGRLQMINGSLFRLNMIKDFDDSVSETTAIELTKVLEARNPIVKKVTYTDTIFAPDPNPSSSRVSYYITDVDYLINADKYDTIEVTTTGTTITLPLDTTGLFGYQVTIKNSSTGDININAPKLLFEGLSSQVLPSGDSYRINFNGTTYKIM